MENEKQAEESLQVQCLRLEQQFESAKNRRFDDTYDSYSGQSMREFIELCFDLEAVYEKLGLLEKQDIVRDYRESTTKFYSEEMYRTYGY